MIEKHAKIAPQNGCEKAPKNDEKISVKIGAFLSENDRSHIAYFARFIVKKCHRVCHRV